MISGSHAIIYSTDPAADRAFFRDVLELSHVDDGGGWLIFGLPASEFGVHPGDKNNVHTFYLTCDDVGELTAALEGQGVACSPVENHEWGLLTNVTLPGGGELGIYQPLHSRP